MGKQSETASSVVVERTTSMGTTIRVNLEPAGDGRVIVHEYLRRAKGGSRFQRVASEEGVVVPFEKLGLEQSYEALFGLDEAA